jgi:hypothetical protein
MPDNDTLSKADIKLRRKRAAKAISMISDISGIAFLMFPDDAEEELPYMAYSEEMEQLVASLALARFKELGVTRLRKPGWIIC